MDAYRRVHKPKEESDIEEKEIRITTQGKPRNFITYATGLFKEKGATEVVLKAMGRAISKTVTIAEIIKRRIPGLHQITHIDSTDITDVFEPLEEGLDRIETTRHVSSITITLSTLPLDTTAPGYQPPLPQDQVKEINNIPKKPIRKPSNQGEGGTQEPGRQRFHNDRPHFQHDGRQGRVPGGRRPGGPRRISTEDQPEGTENRRGSRGRGFRGRGGFRGRRFGGYHNHHNHNNNMIGNGNGNGDGEQMESYGGNRGRGGRGGRHFHQGGRPFGRGRGRGFGGRGRGFGGRGGRFPRGPRRNNEHENAGEEAGSSQGDS
eukprot:TRINITY_DN23550_c0_g1_i1.p1 TRINITY_DN23550_c0_g1~~TRINITY_DN23550_c0_g1_i1.p1  ORF type:complete len:319 (-),score=105.53 TRINITY_DN23550_c0_g1_i1:107-1063(-)